MENPFPSTVISDWTFLDTSAQDRTACPLCNKSRKYYCYTCFKALPHIANKIPKVKLPIQVDIIKHPSEIDGKSTSAHAAVLAPDHVTVYTYPCIPDYDADSTVLLFPCEDSKGLEELKDSLYRDKSQFSKADCENAPNNLTSESRNMPPSSISNFREDDENICKNQRKRPYSDTQEVTNGVLSKQAKVDEIEKLPFTTVVFIDSTWNQTRNIVNDERLKGLPKVELKSQTTHFWRSQAGIPNTYLSTIEAIYYFVRDLHRLFITTDYKNEYDNLLFFFCFMYNKIQTAKNNSKAKHKK